MFELGPQHAVPLTLYTDAFVVKGQLETRQRRITDMLNLGDDRFLVLSDVIFDEFGTTGRTVRAEFAQVNLSSVLFAVADEPVPPAPELRTPKVAEQALISIPPFKVTGFIHLLPERSLREALSELTGHFVPVTGAVYWSDSLGEARASANLVAVNHQRAQILAPHHEVDPWAGLDQRQANEPPTGGDAGWGREPESGSDAGWGRDPAWPETDRPPSG
jgi:hypothetical protein